MKLGHADLTIAVAASICVPTALACTTMGLLIIPEIERLIA
jgi:hypothetical protein